MRDVPEVGPGSPGAAYPAAEIHKPSPVPDRIILIPTEGSVHLARALPKFAVEPRVAGSRKEVSR